MGYLEFAVIILSIFFERQMYLCALSEVQYAAKMKERDQRHNLGISYDVAATSNCQFLLCHSCIHTYRHIHILCTQ